MYNGIMAYREDYEKAASEVESLLEQSEQIEEKIVAARKRMAALGTLLGLDREWKGNRKLVNEPGPLDDRKYARTRSFIESRVSDHIRRLMHTGRAFTAKEIRAELEQMGFQMSAHSNPLATINAVCVSLTESGELRRVEKHGRKAWQSTKATSPEVSLTPKKHSA